MRLRLATAMLVTTAIIAAGCGDGTDADPSPTATPAPAAASPTTSADPAADDTGDAAGGQSYARVPDATGEFQTVDTPTPGAPNRP